mmetsp:Transcript_19490/g.30980  ORF Transcript_19490/g.30980 Transcript_19490/m.30980 type:complete len:230 (+) Transcript_19490:742-1431(+)
MSLFTGHLLLQFISKILCCLTRWQPSSVILLFIASGATRSDITGSSTAFGSNGSSAIGALIHCVLNLRQSALQRLVEFLQRLCVSLRSLDHHTAFLIDHLGILCCRIDLVVFRQLHDLRHNGFGKRLLEINLLVILSHIILEILKHLQNACILLLFLSVFFAHHFNGVWRRHLTRNTLFRFFALVRFQQSSLIHILALKLAQLLLEHCSSDRGCWFLPLLHLRSKVHFV